MSVRVQPWSRSRPCSYGQPIRRIPRRHLRPRPIGDAPLESLQHRHGLVRVNRHGRVPVEDVDAWLVRATRDGQAGDGADGQDVLLGDGDDELRVQDGRLGPVGRARRARDVQLADALVLFRVVDQRGAGDGDGGEGTVVLVEGFELGETCGRVVSLSVGQSDTGGFGAGHTFCVTAISSGYVRP